MPGDNGSCPDAAHMTVMTLHIPQALDIVCVWANELSTRTTMLLLQFNGCSALRARRPDASDTGRSSEAVVAGPEGPGRPV